MDLFERRRIHDDLHYWLRRLANRLAVRSPIRLRSLLLFLGSGLLTLLAIIGLSATDMSQEAVYMTGIFILAALLWVTEALPLFATALLVIALEIILLANPGSWSGLGFETGASPDYREFLAPLSDPIIILFLGGFLMAQAAIKEGVDKTLASLVLRFFGQRPLQVMIGLMLITAFFSMWMSNTATTAMMITLVVPMLAQIPPGDKLRKVLVLSVPFAANIGGMGTPISSPPNAVAVGVLLKEGYTITFLEWMLIAVPLMLILLVVVGLLLWVLFRPTNQGLQFEPNGQPLGGRGLFVIGVMVITIALWLTDQIHGLPTAVVALVPTVAFTATGLLGRRDFNSLEWHILILIGGGIALGYGMQRTGLDEILVQGVPLEGTSAVAALVVVTLLFSTFMSNTAAANLLLPVGVSFATAASMNADPSAYQLAISIALVASTAMALPVSTPPNAIAYAHNEFQTRDMVVAGGLVSVLSAVLIIFFGPLVIDFWLGVFGH